MSEHDFDDEDFAAWELPVLEDNQAIDTSKTNAFNRQSTWKYEPPEEVEEILPPTAEEIAQIRQSAYKEGFEQGKEEGLASGFEEGKQQGFEEGKQQGLEEGHKEGLESGQQELDELTATWQSLMDNLHNPLLAVEESLKSELIKLSVALAKGVIRCEVTTNPEVLVNALDAGLKTLPIQETQYQIHLHPDDVELVKQRFTAEQIDKQNWLLIESAIMTRGGCDISTQNNAVDVSIERRVRDVMDKFMLEQGLTDIEPE